MDRCPDGCILLCLSRYEVPLCVKNLTHKGTLYIIFYTHTVSLCVSGINLIEIHGSVHNFKTRKYTFVSLDRRTDILTFRYLLGISFVKNYPTLG